MHQQGGTLAANDITIHRGADAILERVSLAVTPGSRIGVVGPNGRGKTTLLRALAGLEPLDGGSITHNPQTVRVGYLPQERDLAPEETLLSYLARRTGVGEVEAELAALEAALEDDPSATEAHAEALDRFLALGGDDFEARARGVLADVGLEASLYRPAGALSGGEKGRAALASILLARFDVFLLDEPTNDLDFAGLDLLERFLLGVEGGVVLVSHDRALLDRTVNRIVELESGTQRVHHYAGAVLRVRETFVRNRIDTPKSEAGARTIPLDPLLADELFQHRARTQFAGEDERVFCHPLTGGPLDHKRYAETLKAALAKAEIVGPMRPFHDGRHSAITNGAAAGVNPFALMKRAGHTDLKTTQIYVDLAGETFREEAVRIGERVFASVGHKSGHN